MARSHCSLKYLAFSTNSLKDEGAGFGVDTNKITIFRNDGMVEAYPRKPKQQVAGDIVDSIVKMIE